MQPEKHPVTVFETENHNKHAKDDYFLNSSDKIRFFYEDGAVNKEGALIVDKSQAFNKIGHALHALSPVFKSVSFSNKVKQLVKAIGYIDPQIVQSMYIFKQPRIGGSVTPHYDATFLYVEPIEHLMGLWFPIDDATIDNGCLWFIPGSHKTNSTQYRFIRTHAQDMDQPAVVFRGTEPQYNDSEFVPAPVKKGSCVLIHGLVVHKSEANRSANPRHAYTMHVVESKDTQWSPDNWLQETDSYKFPFLY